MKSLSLIQTIVLLHEKEPFKSRVKFKSHKIEHLYATSKNIAKAKKLAHRVLGRNLINLPTQTKILFLIIEEMAEKYSAMKKIEHSGFRFTRENVKSKTGWSTGQLVEHLNRLEALHYLLSHRNKNKEVFQYELLHRSKSRTTFVLDLAEQQSSFQEQACNPRLRRKD